MKTVEAEQIKKSDELVLITYLNGDNPILCKKEEFSVGAAGAWISSDCIISEITVNKVYTVKNTLSLVEKE